MNVNDTPPQIKLKSLKFSFNRLKNTGKEHKKLKTFYETSNIFDYLLIHPISSGVFKDNHRKLINFKYMDWCVLDIDEGMDLDEAIQNIFCDQAHIIATSFSHTPEKPRFRVLRPLARRITDLGEARATLQTEVKRYGADPKCAQPAALFFQCKQIVSVFEDGFAVDVIPAPQSTPSSSKHWPKGIISSYLIRKQNRTIKLGERDQVCWRLAMDLIRSGCDHAQASAYIEGNYRFENVPNDPFGSAQIRSKVDSAIKSLKDRS